MINYQTIIDDALHGQRSAARPTPDSSDEIEAVDSSAWSLLVSQETWLGQLTELLKQSNATGTRLSSRGGGPHAAVLRELQRVVADHPGPRDHKRWARRIIARIAAGDSGVKPYQARAALEALCAPDAPDAPVQGWSHD